MTRWGLWSAPGSSMWLSRPTTTTSAAVAATRGSGAPHEVAAAPGAVAPSAARSRPSTTAARAAYVLTPRSVGGTPPRGGRRASADGEVAHDRHVLVLRRLAGGAGQGRPRVVLLAPDRVGEAGP